MLSVRQLVAQNTYYQAVCCYKFIIGVRQSIVISTIQCEMVGRTLKIYNDASIKGRYKIQGSLKRYNDRL